jgi:ParB-like chromosome segregation protein Spo0J
VPEIDVLVRTLAPNQAPAELELIENVQRRELSDAEEADAFIQLTRELGRQLQAVAEISGRSVAYVSKRIRLFEDPLLRHAIESGEIATSQAEELLALPESARAELLARSVAQSWTHDEMRAAVRQLTHADTDEAPPSDDRRRAAQPPRFRLENARGEVAIPRPRDLTRRIRELESLLGLLEPFQLTQRDDRALGDLWRTLRRLARAARA